MALSKHNPVGISGCDYMIVFISVNNAATDGDTHFGVAKYVGM